MNNIFKNEVKMAKKGSESFETLFQNSKVKIEKILSNEMSEGEWYEQEGDEWVVLISGTALLEFENTTKELACGEYIYIQKYQKHRVLKTSQDAMWLAVHIK